MAPPVVVEGDAVLPSVLPGDDADGYGPDSAAAPAATQAANAASPAAAPAAASAASAAPTATSAAATRRNILPSRFDGLQRREECHGTVSVYLHCDYFHYYCYFHYFDFLFVPQI